MPAVNYFLGVKRGAPLSLNSVLAGTATSGTAVDVEVRLQINDGANATGLSRKDAVIILEEIIAGFIKNGGANHDGQNLPAL